MRSRLSHVLLFMFAFFRGSTLARAQEAKDVVPEKRAPALVVENHAPPLVVAEPQMTTVYLNYFFPNYCHGYYIGYTMTVPVQVPLGEEKYYMEGGGIYGPATAAPMFPTDPWGAVDPR